MEAGQSADTLAQTTPRQFNAVVKGYSERLRNEHDGRAWLAWHVAAFERSKRLPALKSVLSAKKLKRQSSTQIKGALDAWVTATGGA